MHPRRRPRPAFHPSLPFRTANTFPHRSIHTVSAAQSPSPATTRITISLPKPLGVSLSEKREEHGQSRVVVAAVDSKGVANGLLRVGDIVVGFPGCVTNGLQGVVEGIRSAPENGVTLVLERKKLGSDDSTEGEVTELLSLFMKARREEVGGRAEVLRSALLDAAGVAAKEYGGRGRKGEELIFRLLYRLKRANVELDAKFSNLVMWGLVAAGAAGRVEEVFEEIEGKNVECFTTLIKALSVMKRVDEALRVVQRMRKEGVKPNIRTYNALIAGCVRAGKLEKARNLFSEMLMDEIRPNTVSWNIIINWHVQQKSGSKRLRGALKAFADMKASGVKPNVVTFTTVMKAYSKSGLLNKAEEVFAEIKMRMPSRLDTGVYNTLLGAYAAKLDWRRCMELLDEMDGFYIPDEVGTRGWSGSGGVPSHSQSFSRRRPWLWENAGTGEAATWTTSASSATTAAREASMNGRGFAGTMDVPCLPDAVSFALAVKACASAGRPDKAREVFDEMMERGFRPPPAKAVVSLMAGYARAGMLTESFEVLKNLKAWGVYPEKRMLSSLMHGCLMAGQPALALNVYAKFKSGRFVGDVVVYTLLLKAYGMQGEIEKMMNVLKGMVKSGCLPNVVTFNVVIECALMSNRTDLALKMLDGLLCGASGVRPDRNTFVALTMPVWSETETGEAVFVGVENALFGDAEVRESGVCMEKGACLQYLMDVFRRVKERGGKVNGVLYMGLLKACVATGEWHLGAFFVEERARGAINVGKKEMTEVRGLEDVLRARAITARGEVE